MEKNHRCISYFFLREIISMNIFIFLKKIWVLSCFALINVLGLTYLIICGRKNYQKVIRICENILKKRYSSEIRPFENLVREELSMAYSKYIEEYTKGDPNKIIEARDTIRKWLFNNLILYRNKTKNINTCYLIYGINTCYLYLGKLRKSLLFLMKLRELAPQHKDEIETAIMNRQTILGLDIEDLWEILAFPDKNKGKYNSLISFFPKWVSQDKNDKDNGGSSSTSFYELQVSKFEGKPGQTLAKDKG
jgi:hypothetical protein